MEAAAKSLEERRRKSFAGGNGVANAGEIEIGAARAMMVEQCGIVRGDGEEKRGAMALNVDVDAGGSRARGREDRSCADRKREVTGISETIGEKQARDAEAAIPFVDFEDGMSIVMRADDHVVMEVHAAFGNAGGTGRVEPERRIVFGGGLGVQGMRIVLNR